MADESSKSRRGETREFWEAAIRLWAESGLPVREFCNREGLAEHTFYSWRRELMPENPALEVKQEPTASGDGALATDGRRRRRRKPVANLAGASTSAVEFLPVRVVGEEVSHAHAVSAGATTGAVPIEIVGTSPWRVRILARFDPTTLKAVLAVLERRPC
jgi:transposase-like protein